MPITTALTWPTWKIAIFYNEAVRQESIRSYNLAAAFHDPKKVTENLQDALKVHGPYTLGFHDKELDALRKKMTKKGG